MISMNPSFRNNILFAIGLGVSIVSIVAPLVGIYAGYRPQFMWGFLAGATVRFGTDLALLGLADGSPSDITDFSTGHVPIALTLMFGQIATLLVGGYQALFGHTMIGLGIVTAMLIAYVTGGLISLLTAPTESDTGSDRTDDSEWDVHVDDV